MKEGYLNVQLFFERFREYIEYRTSLPDAVHENEELKTEKSAEKDIRMLVSFLAVCLNKKKENRKCQILGGNMIGKEIIT
jgi:hypothetical protein